MGRNRLRGVGSIYRRRRRDPKTGEWIESPLYWIQYYYHGEHIRRPAKTTERGKAIRFLKEQIAAANSGRRTVIEAECFKFQNLVDLILRDYARNLRKSLPRLQAAIKHLRSFFGNYRALEIQKNLVDCYIDHRRERAANATIHIELAALKRMLNLASDVLGPAPNLPNVRVKNTRKGFFEKTEFKELLEHIEMDLGPVLEFAYLTGWRMKSEVFSLQWPQVDFDAGEIRLEPGTTKTDEGRTFPFRLLPELEDLIRRQREYTDRVQRDTGSIIPWVFHRGGRQIRDIRKAWRRAVEAAGIGDRIPHDFRRTAVHNLELAGVPRSVAMRLVGHKTESIYRRYAIVTKQDLVDGLKRLADYRAAHKEETRPKMVQIDSKRDEILTRSEQPPE